MNERLGRKIGEGGCSEVFLWEGSEKIIKLAKGSTDGEAMRREYHNQCIVWESGLPSARPYGFILLEGRPGIVFERIVGETLMDRFVQQMMNLTEAGGLDDYDFRLTARALTEVHARAAVCSLPSQREAMKHAIQHAGYLTAEEKAQIIAHLDSLPAKSVICHGDPNPNNLLVRSDGSYVLIDWMNASRGNPEADLAEYLIMIKYAVLPSFLPDGAAAYFNENRERIMKAFMDEYGRFSDITLEEVTPWLLPAAARKLTADAISAEEKSLLLQEIRSSLHQLT